MKPTICAARPFRGATEGGEPESVDLGRCRSCVGATVSGIAAEASGERRLHRIAKAIDARPAAIGNAPFICPQCPSR